MSDIEQQIAEHEALEARLTETMQKTQVRSHRIELQRRLAAVHEDLSTMRQARWFNQERREPWMSKR